MTTSTKKPVRFDHYVSSTTGQVLRPRHGIAIARCLEDPRVFSKAHYSTQASPPKVLFSTGDALAQGFPRCLDMPLRLAGDSTYHLPEEWVGLAALVEQIIGVEHANNRNVFDYHTYLTVDSTWVQADAQQRNGGLHVDGFQGARINPKTKVTRNYVATTNGGTRFYPQPFNTDLDESVFNLFEGFDLQAKDPWIAPENMVLFMDAYTVHESGVASRTGLRTFVRVTFDLKKFDRYGNTRNAMLDGHPAYDWDLVERNVHETLRTPTVGDFERPPTVG